VDIWIGSLLEGAAQAKGAVAVIDVFRAFTTAAVVLANGASRIIMVGSVEQAMAMRTSGVGQFCLGEVGGIAPPGFDFGNSPYEVSETDFNGNTVIQRTSAGTQGIITARQAQCLYAASLVTASATARALLGQGQAERISLVAMGSAGLMRTDEDELCALHLRNLIEGRPGNPNALRELILAGGEVRRFNDPTRPHLNHKDVVIALDVDRYEFAIRVTMEDGLLVARRECPQK
jgi:2-phosphosulfolactate phosphatase